MRTSRCGTRVNPTDRLGGTFMTNRPFRFGANLLMASASRAQWRARVREAEDLGYDTLQVPDHLGMVAPFPALMAAADVTRMRLGTYVVNAGVAEPAYLAQNVAEMHRLTDGRFEFGLGAGYVEEESAAVGRPFGTPGSRVRRLAEVLTAVRDRLAAEPDRPVPPIMIAGGGKRVLELGARNADIVSFSILANLGPGGPEDAFAERIGRVRAAAGDRADDIELNLFVAGAGATVADVDLSLGTMMSGRPADEVARMPAYLVGPPAAVAERLLRYREQWGVSYISVLEQDIHAFADVIRHLR
ncbi:TIGR03621 family F420-dependent LLM class oxidoreductase [Micromonospora musae]|uniref:TIGR03621 family F420-dependent LLM class oxidoreductase n=1 Tax=Micromonospora musae TaxID=1894970 RepID=UPI0033DC7EEA